MITYTTKMPLPVGADPAKLKKLDLCKAFDAIFPLSAGSDSDNEALLALLGKSIKHEKKRRAKLAAKAAQGKFKFRAAAKTYLSDKRCLFAALFEQNGRQNLEHRLSLEQLIALAHQYDILKCLNEPAKIWTEPKSSGLGERVICAFGPVARAAQLMVVTVLRMAYQPQEFQFTHLGSAQKVQRAVSLIPEKGYTHVDETDIKDFFPNFTEEALIAALPLPIEAVRHIIMAKSADWSPCYSHISHSYILSPRAYHRAVHLPLRWRIGASQIW